MNIHPQRAGLSLGIMVGGLHLVWALLVALGLAQPLADFIARMHFVQPVLKVTPFSLGTALGLVVLTAIIGFIVGYVLATVWNKVSTSK